MPRVRLATKSQIASIYRESHAFWGAGLTLADYIGLWEEIRRTAWAREHARYLVLSNEAGEVLSSLKLYRPRIRIAGLTGRTTVLGAIFTPKVCRAQGHATRLIRASLDRGRRAGDLAALLFTDIGTRFYENFGFRALPAFEQWGVLPRVGVPDWNFRPLTDAHEEPMRRAHAATAASRGIEVLRDEQHWEFLRVRSGAYFDRVADRSVLPRAWAAEVNGVFQGFVTSVEGRGEWNLRELAALDGSPSTAATLMQAAAADARRRGMRRCYGWVSEDLRSRLRGFRLKRSVRTRAIPMLLPFSADLDSQALDDPSAAYIPYQDQF